MKYFDTDNKEQNMDTQDPNLEKVKIGDSELTLSEIEELVGAGRKLKEIEDKQGQPVEEILTSWGRRGEVIGEQKKQLQELDDLKRSIDNKPVAPQSSEEDEKAQIIAEARKYGLLDKDEAQKMFAELYQANRAGEKLLSQTSRVVARARREGKPATTVDELLQFMADPSNPKDPEKAYKLKFEKELDAYKEAQLNKLRKPDFFTTQESTAGSRQPERQLPKNQEELIRQLQEHMNPSE